MTNSRSKIAKHLASGASLVALAALSLACSAPAFAQDGAAAEEPTTIIVTGVSKKANRLDTSISVSAISFDKAASLAPRGTSEVFRSLPGIRSESSAGGGNSNIGVRGIPVSTGGAKFVQIQEDGLPVMLFGDFDFAPADGFYKVDSTLDRVESVRGGSASTFTTGAPGAIINMISKTGKRDGGSVAIETGLSYRDFKVEGDLGGHLSDDVYFFVGGHYQSGGDVRDLGYNGIEGGQIKASITKEFGEGNYVRVWTKFLDKKDATYMPQAMAISGNEITGGIPGLNAFDTIHSPYIANYLSVNNGQVLHQDLADGFHTISQSVGGEFSFDVGNGFRLTNKTKYAKIGGDFEAPFSHNVADANTTLAANYGGATATIFNGPNAGQTVTSASLKALTGNSLITEVALFDTHLDDLSNFANDLKLNKTVTFADGASLDITAGYFHMTQNFKQNWHWQRFLTTTESDAAMISVAGYTQNGQLGYNNGFGWDGTNRQIDTVYTADAPYVDLTYQTGDLSLNASVRQDTMQQDGNITNATGVPFDVNGDGVISTAESDVSVNQGLGNIDYFNFDISHTSYSFGANYKLKPNLAVFARYSNGAAYNGERQVGSGAYNPKSGSLLVEDSFVDVVKQLELGVKWNAKDVFGGSLDLAATYFDANTEESQTDTTTVPPKAFNIGYDSKGIELEGLYRKGAFTFNGTVTSTDAVITSGTYKGNKPRRQADLIWNMNASYTVGKFDVGANINGTTDSYAGMSNLYVMPGYSVVSAYVNWHLSDKLVASINANNLFDQVGITEAEEDAGRYWDTNNDGKIDMTSARSIAGRTISARLKYSF